LANDDVDVRPALGLAAAGVVFARTELDVGVIDAAAFGALLAAALGAEARRRAFLFVGRRAFRLVWRRKGRLLLVLLGLLVLVHQSFKQRLLDIGALLRAG
jgi:hypothetical protein